MAPDADWVWLAGLIDGEGSLTYQRFQDKRNLSWSPGYAATLQIGMCSQEAVAKAANLLGVHVYSYGKTHKGWRTEYRCIARGHRLEQVLTRILPHLTAKRQQAELVLAALESCPAVKGRSFSNEELALREGYYRAVQQANAM